MKFTPSSLWSLLEWSRSKGLQWKAYSRPIGHLSGSLTSGSWTDVSDYLDGVPTIEDRVELEVGEFVTNKVSVSGMDLVYWRDSVLTTGSAYTEMKFVLDLASTLTVTTDNAIVFSGFVARDTLEYNELTDRVKFDVMTAQDVGSRIAGDYLSTKYLFYDIKDDDTDISGSVLQNIPGVFIRSANPPKNAIFNGSFSRFTGSPDDGFSDTFDSWHNNTVGGLVEATGDGLGGYGVKLYRNVSIGAGPSINGIDQTCPVTGGVTYEFQFTARAEAESVASVFSIYDMTTGSYIVSASSANLFPTWDTFSYVFTPPTGTTSVKIYLTSHNSPTGSHIYYDDVSLLPRQPVTYSSSLAPPVGAHSVAYSYNGGSPNVSLDGGRSVSLVHGTTIIGDSDVEMNDRYQVHVYVRSGSLGYATSSVFSKLDGEEEFVVLTQGENLPRQWFRNSSGASILKKTLALMGITGSSITFGGLTMPSATGAKIVYLGNPPETGSIASPKNAIATDGTDLFIGVGSQVWKRTTATDEYTLLGDVGAGMEIGRLFYQSRYGDLWIVYGKDRDVNKNGTKKSGRVRKYSTTGSSLSAEVKLYGTGESDSYMDFEPQSCDLMDFNYNAGYYVYGLLATDEGNTTSSCRIAFVTGSMTRTDLGSFGYIGNYISSDFAYVSGGKFRFSTYPSGTFRVMHQISVLAEGGAAFSWNNDGYICGGSTSSLPDYTSASYDPGDNKVYFSHKFGSNVWSHPTNSAVSTSVCELPVGAVVSFAYASASFYSVQTTSSFLNYWDDSFNIYKIEGGVSTLVGSGSAFQGTGVTAIGSIIYGLDQNGRLFTYGTSSVPFIPTARFGDSSVRDAFTSILRAYVLVASLAGKSSWVYQRTNRSGVFNTTGTTSSVTIAEGSDITMTSLPRFDLIGVSNGNEGTTYDGTTFGVSVLSDRRRVDIDSDLIHRSLLRDVASQAWQFFGSAHSTYTVPLPGYPAVEYQPLDAVTLTLPTTKIAVSKTGVLVATKIDLDGTLVFEVMT